MAEQRARHAFGSSNSIEAAKQAKKIDAYDILFLDGDTDNPKIGWLDSQGNTVIVRDKNQIVRVKELPTVDGDENVVYVYNNECYIWNGSQCVSTCKPVDLTELEAEISNIETALDGVTNASHTHEKIKYEITDVPVGTLVDYRDDEIRIMCPTSAVWEKQAVGVGGDANSYYCTFKTYACNDDAVGYIEHLNGKSDSEVLTDLKTDKYGRRYQPTWLALAKYNETTDVWTYYGDSSSTDKYIGYDYQIDWYNADGIIIASDSIRINLSNADCHYAKEPYYVGKMIKEIETKIDEKVAEIDSAYEIIEF